MAYTLGNKCAKNICKRTVIGQLIIENVVTCFFETQCISKFIIIHMTNACAYNTLRSPYVVANPRVCAV